MNIFSLFQSYITKAVQGIDSKQKFDENSAHFTVEAPNNPANGDISTNIAMVIADNMGLQPKALAEAIALRLQLVPEIKSVQVAGPGFINIKLKTEFWYTFLRDIYLIGKSYGDSKIGKNQVFNIEFVSANPTGPMHVGHARSAIYGDTLANLLQKCGFSVVKEYYINDAGKQIDTLVESTFIRYQQALGRSVDFPQGCYPGEYLITIARKAHETYGEQLLTLPPPARNELLRNVVLQEIMQLIKKDLQDLGVFHDVFTSEREDILEKGKLQETLTALTTQGLIYLGKLEAPKSKTNEDWEPTEQTLFKATQFGDKVDRPMVRSDGSYTYFALDAAYHLDKLQRGFHNMILLLGADHGGYIKRISAIVKALSEGKAKIHVIINQLVNLMKDGQPFKMSKRTGNFLTIQDMLQEVDKDILRFAMLSRKNDTVFDLDFSKLKEQTKDNPVFYVQYAHTRAYSVLRKAKSQNIECNLEEATLSLLSLESDLPLIKKIAQFPRILENVARTYEVYKITYYLYDLATLFHQIWSKGNQDEKARFIVEGEAGLTKARLILVKTLANTIASGLKIMGIEPVYEM